MADYLSREIVHALANPRRESRRSRKTSIHTPTRRERDGSTAVLFDGGSVGSSEGQHTGTYVGFACVHTALHMFGKGCGCHLRGSRARRGAMWLALWRPSSRSASSTPPSPVATGGAMVARRDVRHRRPIIAASLRITAPSACHWHAARDSPSSNPLSF